MHVLTHKKSYRKCCNVLVLCHGYISVCGTLTLLPKIPVKCPNLFDFSIKDSKLSEKWNGLSKQAERATGNSSVSNASKEASLQRFKFVMIVVWTNRSGKCGFKVVLKDLMRKVLCCYVGWELKWNINIWFLQLSY